ncbi:MAG: class I SAM-dependent methyltransferase, partial [Thermoplasmata archaeon]
VFTIEWLGGNVELAPPEKRSHTGWDPFYQLDRLIPNLRNPPAVPNNIVLLIGESLRVLWLLGFNGPVHFSLILLDGSKAEDHVFQELERAWPLLLPGGTLFMDDWLASASDESKGTVQRAWERFAELHALSDLTVDLFGFQPGPGNDPKLARIRKPA